MIKKYPPETKLRKYMTTITVHLVGTYTPMALMVKSLLDTLDNAITTNPHGSRTPFKLALLRCLLLVIDEYNKLVRDEDKEGYVVLLPLFTEGSRRRQKDPDAVKTGA